MNSRAENGGSNGFLIGLITGAALGAGIAIAFGPRLASGLRQVTASAADLTQAASQRYQDVSTRVAEARSDVTAKGQAIRNDVADAIGRGAREVEQYAMAAKTVPGPRRS